MNFTGRRCAGHVADCGAIVIVAIWITAAIFWAELGGIPHLYGWPLTVLRPEGYDQPSVWVWIVDALGAFAAITATWWMAVRCCRAINRGYQFRLSSLLGAVATIAVIAAIWRWSDDHLGDLFVSLDDQADDEIGTSAMVQLTAFMVWLPPLVRPFQLVVRLGVVAGLGCAVYLAGWLSLRLGAQARRRLCHGSDQHRIN